MRRKDRVAETPHPGTQDGSASIPGRGEYDDVYLATASGSSAWPLTDINGEIPSGQLTGCTLNTIPGTSTPILGTMWGRFDHTGNQVVFAAMTATPGQTNTLFGYWDVITATISWTGASHSVPCLTSTHVIDPAADTFNEPYGFTPSNTGVIFDSSDDTDERDSQVYTANVDGSDLTRVSGGPMSQGVFTNYDEFAYYTPAQSELLYGSTYEGDSDDLEQWQANADGSSSQRMTYFGATWSTEYLGGGGLDAGGVAFNPSNPNQYLLNVAPLASGDATGPFVYPGGAAELVTLAPSSTGGLEATYYPNLNGTGAVGSGVSSPSEPWEWESPPESGLPSTDYRVDWTGTLTPTTTGTYTFCTVADGGMQVLVNGVEVVNGWKADPGTSVCASDSLTQGTSYTFEVDYWHGTGAKALGQLSWELPGQSTKSIIPLADLAP